MSDRLDAFRFILEGDIVIDSLFPVNTSGAFCDLFTATHPTAGKLALKRPRGDYNEQLMTRIEIEAGVWASLKHPRILQFLGIHKIGNELYFVSAFADNGSLPGFLERHPEVDRGRLIIEIAEGLAYLHQFGIIHGDLKGNNVLISGGYHVLLCDFGLAKHVTSRTSTSLRGVGSIPWQSPELLQDACRRTFQSDVYAFGITIYEVLSGMEPYAHHSGIGSIITCVIFSGERPPKEPLTALDGTSYLQFWDEASKCWAENSALRPRIIEVLNRLDHHRAEAFVTSQQVALEDSLVPVEGDLSRYQLDSALHLSPQDRDGPSIRDTLDWAHRIRFRLNTFVNSQQPISRIPRGILIEILMVDVEEDDRPGSGGIGRSRMRRCSFEEEDPWTSDFKTWANLPVKQLIRCARLRNVHRAWRDAIDSTPEFTRYALVGRGKSNIQYVQQHNNDSPLECFVHTEDGLTPSELSSFLEPLAHRLHSLNTYSTNLQFGPTPFPMLRAIRMFNLWVSDTFVSDLLGMLGSHPDLTDLILERLICSDSGFKGSPRLRVDHPGLQRLRLAGLPPTFQFQLLSSLRLKSSVTLIVDGVHPSHLGSPDSSVGNIIRSQGRTDLSHSIWRELVVTGDPNVEPGKGENMVEFTWPRIGHRQPDELDDERQGRTWKFNQVTSGRLSNSDAMDLIRELQDAGIMDPLCLDARHRESKKRDRHCIFCGRETLLELFRCLSSVKKLIIRTADAGRFLPTLVEPDLGATDQGQFRCPSLTQLEVQRDTRQFFSWSGDEEVDTFQEDIRVSPKATIYEFIRKRQIMARSPNGPAKLQRIGIPRVYMDETLFEDPALDGIEFYETSHW